jgi:hypothetical protein
MENGMSAFAFQFKSRGKVVLNQGFGDKVPSSIHVQERIPPGLPKYSMSIVTIVNGFLLTCSDY